MQKRIHFSPIGQQYFAVLDVIGTKRASKIRLNGVATLSYSTKRPKHLHAPDSDNIYVSRVARGDQAAARLLLERHGDTIMAIAYRILGNRQAAEDVVQETFLKLWQKAGRWTPGAAKFSSWLCRIAINLCYDRLRKASYKYEKVTDAQEVALDVKDTAADPFTSLSRSEVSCQVRTALSRLPPRQQAALALVLYQDVTNKEAAETLNISVEALESLLARARRALRQDTTLCALYCEMVEGSSE